MYIDSYLKALFRKANIPTIIYMILNIALICAFTTLILSDAGVTTGGGIAIGIGVYLLSVATALSPAGEWMVRVQNHCKRITDPGILNYVTPIFQEVYARAKKENPTIPDDVQFFMNEDDEPNAFATGRKTICMTKGILHVPEDELKATLGHEFGHISHHDTDTLLVITVGNTLITVIVALVRIALWILYGITRIFALFLGDDSCLVSLPSTIIHALALLTVNAIMWIWTKLGVLLCLKTSRSNEFEADRFSCELGYSDSLIRLFHRLSVGEYQSSRGFFAILASTHPETNLRIEAIQKWQREVGHQQMTAGYVYPNQQNQQQRYQQIQSYSYEDSHDKRPESETVSKKTAGGISMASTIAAAVLFFSVIGLLVYFTLSGTGTISDSSPFGNETEGHATTELSETTDLKHELVSHPWENNIQYPATYRFYDDGTGIRDPGEITEETLTWNLAGNVLYITWENGYVTKLKALKKGSDEEKAVNYDLGIKHSIDEIPDGRIFFYETTWTEASDPYGNATYIREADF